MGRLPAATLALCLLFLGAACGEEPEPEAAGMAAPHPSPMGGPPVVPPPPPGSGSGAAALTWTVPAGWVEEAPSTPMRKAQYRIAGEAGDAQCVVFYFGPGEGGGAMANAERWAAQFTLPDGRPGSAGMKLERRTVGDIEVLMVEVSGTHQPGFRMQTPPPEPIPGQMLLGAIAEGPDANWFFKLTGPEETVSAQRAAFEDLVESFKRGS